MSKQMIIALSREFGSGGTDIARALAERFELPLYEKNTLEYIAREKGLDANNLIPYDETPRFPFLHRTVNGFSSAPGVIIAQMQFQFLRNRAEQGESFMVLGRCAEEVFRDHPGLITIFIMADVDFKTARLLERGAPNRRKARTSMIREDLKRKTYHDQFCNGKWGDPANYDLIVNSARLGIDGTTDFLERYIRARIDQLST